MICIIHLIYLCLKYNTLGYVVQYSIYGTIRIRLEGLNRFKFLNISIPVVSVHPSYQFVIIVTSNYHGYNYYQYCILSK